MLSLSHCSNQAAAFQWTFLSLTSKLLRLDWSSTSLPRNQWTDWVCPPSITPHLLGAMTQGCSDDGILTQVRRWGYRRSEGHVCEEFTLPVRHTKETETVTSLPLAQRKPSCNKWRRNWTTCAAATLRRFGVKICGYIGQLSSNLLLFTAAPPLSPVIWVRVKEQRARVLYTLMHFTKAPDRSRIFSIYCLTFLSTNWNPCLI